MFKNCVFKASVDTKLWITNAGIRALKTFCQTAISLITVGSLITALNWIEIIEISATSAVVSILTSITGLPEVEPKEGE